MRRIVSLDIGLIAVFGFMLLALVPLLMQVGLPNGSDVLYHVYRTAEMSRSWEAGTFFPRWAAGFYTGYGSPIWHFYANLAYWISAALMQVFGLSALDALRWLIVVCYVGMGTGMYLFARQQINRVGGVLAALAYLYSPYLIYTEPYARGTYPEMLAFALFPFVMWRFGLLLRYRRGVDVALAALTLFLLIIAHNLMALALTALLCAWLIWNGVATHIAGQSLRPYVLAASAVVLGIGLAAYFWLPVLLEADTVNLRNLTGVALLDYRNFFVPLADLLGPMPRPDLGSINGLRNVTVLGLPQWTLALAGFITTLIFIGRQLRAGKHDDALLRQGVYFALLALMLLFLVTLTARPLWETLRFLPLLQFPWRLLGPMAFCLAFLVGMNALWLLRLPVRYAVPALALMIAYIVVLALPALTVPEWSHTRVDTSMVAYHQNEMDGRQSGTTFTDEYRPSTVYTPPGPTPALLADYADGYPVDRANIPPNVNADVTLLDSGVQHNEWRIRSEAALRLEVLTYDWAGWQATIDDEPVPITPSAEHGLMTLQVPAGTHSVRVELGPTPARTLGQFISLVALLLTLAMLRVVHQPSAILGYTPPTGPDTSGPYTAIASFPAAVLVLLALLLDRQFGLSWYASAAGAALPAQHDVTYTLDDRLQVIGYDLNRATFSPGDVLRLTLYWYATTDQTAAEADAVDFSSFVHIAKPATPPLAQADKLHPGGRAVSEWWSPAGYIHDAYRITLAPDIPAGDYTLFVGLYTCELMPPGACGNGYRPQVRDAEGQIIGDSIPLATITVK